MDDEKKPSGRQPEDLTGRQFGSLTVLYPAEKRKGRTAWVCRCACGSLHIATAHDLKVGKVKSCGCWRSSHPRPHRDLTGQRFGRLTVLFPTEKRSGRGSVIWRCRCDCGKEVEVSADHLLYGNYRSCGCLKEEHQKQIYRELHQIDGTCIEILERRKHRSDNTSGCQGVTCLKNGRYRVDIGFKRQRYYVGTYKTYEEAVSARQEVEEVIHKGFLNAYQDWKESKTDIPFIFEVEKVGNGSFRVRRS